MTSFVQDKLLTLALEGDIDHHSAKRLMQEITLKIQEYLPRVCILDLSDVTFMDSSGIALVICALRRMKELDGVVELQRVPRQPEKVLLAAGVNRIIQFRREENTL